MNLLKYGSLFCLFFTCYLHLVCAQISPTQVTVSSPSSSISESAVAAILVVAIIVTALILYALVLMILKVRGRYYPRQHRSSSRSPTVTNGLKRFTREEMALATENFGQSNLIGKGGYGKVYKGIVANHAAVAIKCAQEGSLQGEREFRTEIELLSNLHHRNLVSLIGYCDDQGQQMLVYEYMENGTLLDWLFDDFIEPLTFNQRLGIALGAARGLLYLHAENNPPIIHRDVKASNILLDSSFRPKVGDFGLSRLGPVPDNEGNVPSHVSTIPKGTPGYMDPNYFYTGELTPKSDVYSLGVVFLELLTGRNAILNHQNLVIKVNLVYQSRHQLSLIDKNMGHYPDECMRRFLVLALDCCKEQPDARPNMSEVVRELEDICSMMPESSARDLRD